MIVIFLNTTRIAAWLLDKTTGPSSVHIRAAWGLGQSPSSSQPRFAKPLGHLVNGQAPSSGRPVRQTTPPERSSLTRRGPRFVKAVGLGFARWRSPETTFTLALTNWGGAYNQERLAEWASIERKESAIAQYAIKM